MKKSILTIALAFAFAIPFAGFADAYGERWYMVKVKTAVYTDPKENTYIRWCLLNKGDRIERLNRETKKGMHSHAYFYSRKVGGHPWCKGWVPSSVFLYNMDTVVENLNYYSNLGETVPVWQHSSAIWASRNKARSAPPLPSEKHYMVKYDNTLVRDGPGTACTVGKGTKVRLEKKHETFGQVFADVTVLAGPHKGCYGYVRFQRIERDANAQWVHNAPKVCDIPVGTKVHVFEDQFNGAARIKVIDGPCRNREGWILSYTLRR